MREPEGSLIQVQRNLGIVHKNSFDGETDQDNLYMTGNLLDTNFEPDYKQKNDESLSMTMMSGLGRRKDVNQMNEEIKMLKNQNWEIQE